MQVNWATPGFDDWELAKWHSVLQTLSNNKYFGIEPMIAEPYQLDAIKIKDMLEQYGLVLYGLRTGGITINHNVYFSHPDAKVRIEAVRRFKEIIQYGSQFGHPRLLVGLLQGRVLENQSITEAEENIILSLQECAEVAEQYQMEIDLEPVNRYELNYHNSAASVMAFIERIGSPNIRLLIDAFHMNIEEARIEDTLHDVRNVLAHVHLSDSNRSIPGKGHLDFKNIFETLKVIDYKGNLTIEAICESDPNEIMQTINYLDNFQVRSN